MSARFYETDKFDASAVAELPLIAGMPNAAFSSVTAGRSSRPYAPASHIRPLLTDVGATRPHIRSKQEETTR
jgi:hypothetical protein